MPNAPDRAIDALPGISLGNPFDERWFTTPAAEGERLLASSPRSSSAQVRQGSRPAGAPVSGTPCAR